MLCGPHVVLCGSLSWYTSNPHLQNMQCYEIGMNQTFACMIQLPPGMPWELHVPFTVLLRRVLGDVLPQSMRDKLALTEVLRAKDMTSLQQLAKPVYKAWLELVEVRRQARLLQLAQTRASRQATAQAVTQATTRVAQLSMVAPPPATQQQGAAVAAAATAAHGATDADDNDDEEAIAEMEDMISAALLANADGEMDE
jgi:hypothetical protein